MNAVRLRVLPALAVMAMAACATSPAAAGPVPSRADVATALEHELNTMCDGDIESETCTSHPSAVSVTELRCAPQGGGIARCRYSVRVRSIYAGNQWRDEAARFRFDGNRQIWSLIGDF